MKIGGNLMSRRFVERTTPVPSSGSPWIAMLALCALLMSLASCTKRNTNAADKSADPPGGDNVGARRSADGDLTAIGVLTEINRAQQEYLSQPHDGAQQYAQKIVSDEGNQNGLYWPVAEGQPRSPLSRLADFAKALGYSHNDKPQPFNGYYFRVLTKQGATAKGGDKDYMTNGKLSGGFAVMAYPATYGDSGIMSCIVGTDGVVYEKDVGENTAAAAVAITEYNPRDGCSVVLAPEIAKAPATLRALKT